jgi:hypothetical protein
VINHLHYESLIIRLEYQHSTPPLPFLILHAVYKILIILRCIETFEDILLFQIKVLSDLSELSIVILDYLNILVLYLNVDIMIRYLYVLGVPLIRL